MSVVLSIESSTKVGSIALHVDGQLLIYHESFIEKSHSEHLAKTLSNVLVEASVAPREVDAVAVSKGPGSYTGLRIGVSIAKGFCYAHDIKLIAVDTLLSMAYEIREMGLTDSLYCPMIDARRMEVYCQVFDKDLVPVNEVEAVIMDKNSFQQLLQYNKIYFFGNGSEKCKGLLNHYGASFVDGIYPKAKNIGDLAVKKLSEGIVENLAYFEPYYLKEFMVKKPSGKNLV